MPSLFRKGEQDIGEELEHAPATMTARPGDRPAGEEQAEPHDAAGSAAGKAGRTAHAEQREVGTKVIVLAGRQAADGHSDAYVFDGPEQAVEFIRSAIDGGLEPSHIHVFIGAEMRLNVVYRLEVNLEPPAAPDQ